jgi:hypothetical protein
LLFLHLPLSDRRPFLIFVKPTSKHPNHGCPSFSMHIAGAYFSVSVSVSGSGSGSGINVVIIPTGRGRRRGS